MTKSTPTYGAQEQAALDALVPACNDMDSEATMDVRAKKTLELIQEETPLGPNETVVSVLRFVRNSIPEQMQPMPCVQIMAMYSQMRTNGSITPP